MVVDYYVKINGRCPAKEFLDDLPADHRAKIDYKIDLLEEFGSELKRPHSGPLRDKIFELRQSVGTIQYRLLYFFTGSKIIIISHCIIKKQGPVPREEIERAKEYRADYMVRHQDRDKK